VSDDATKGSENPSPGFGLTALTLALPSDVPARGDIDEAVRRDSRGVGDALVVAEAGFVVAVCVLGVEEFNAVVGGWFRRLSFYFGELGWFTRWEYERALRKLTSLRHG